MLKHMKKYIPDQEKLRRQKGIGIVGERLFDPALWHMSRWTVSKALAIGIFWAWVPMPFQMIPASICAILFRANAPIAIAGVWISNPLTMLPLYYSGYYLGGLILQQPSMRLDSFTVDFTLEWFVSVFASIWQPMYLGCFLIGTTFALVFFFATLLLWKEAPTETPPEPSD